MKITAHDKRHTDYPISAEVKAAVATLLDAGLTESNRFTCVLMHRADADIETLLSNPLIILQEEGVTLAVYTEETNTEAAFHQVIKDFVTDPTNPQKRQAIRAAYDNLPDDPEFAAMSEAEKFEEFCAIYRSVPEERRAQ